MPPRHNADSRTLDSLESAIADERDAQLAKRIHDRIAKRLSGRIQALDVHVAGKSITLRGKCATYYSKQLAQHAALGVLEDETLTNAIVVGTAR